MEQGYVKIVVKNGKIVGEKKTAKRKLKKVKKEKIKRICVCYKCEKIIPPQKTKFCCRRCQEAQYRKYGKILNECYNIVRSYNISRLTGKV